MAPACRRSTWRSCSAGLSRISRTRARPTDSRKRAMPSAAPNSLTVLVYSSHASTREKVLMSLGRRPAPDIARLEYVECSSGDEVTDVLDAGGVDLAILDGEASPTGGIGLSRQLKN